MTLQIEGEEIDITENDNSDESILFEDIDKNKEEQMEILRKRFSLR